MDAKVALLKEAQSSGQIGPTFPPRFLLTAVMASPRLGRRQAPLVRLSILIRLSILRFTTEYRSGRTASPEGQGAWLTSSLSAKRLFEKARV